jgi:GT2 family glycosyltransferase
LEILSVGLERVQRFVLDRDDAHRFSSGGVSAASFAILDEEGDSRRLDLALDGGIVATVPTPPARWSVGPARIRGASATSPTSMSLNVIVPVYEDFEATRACLTSLARQESETTTRIIVVDDASPNAELGDYLVVAAGRGDFELVRNATNLGFARAVNVALSGVESGDVLLLNADAWLPPGAIDRLARVARSAPDIGTVTPFSNNGEFTSYPAPNVANPMPPHEQIRQLDAWARLANGDGSVDLPNGIGFCLYVTRACLDAVGPLSEVYLRGYYEDVEFCLEARERGFRNVCATGVFVGHAGSLSFGDAKRALVVRNLGVLESRFPGYRMRSAAFLAADPLRRARAAIDESAPPEGESIFLVSGPGKSKRLAGLRARELAATTPGAVLHGAADLAGRRIEIRREGGGAPQSLAFRLDDPDGAERLRLYIDRMTIRRLEIYNAPAIPEEMLRPLMAASGRVEMICGDLEGFVGLAAPHFGSCRGASDLDLCEPCGGGFPSRVGDADGGARSRERLQLGLAHAAAIRPLDRMGEAFSRRVFKAKALALDEDAPPGTRLDPAVAVGAPVLGVLAPLPSTAADRLILRLARLFARSRVETTIVVLGRCVDDLALMAAGNVFVTGAAEPDEYERLAEQYGVGPLWLPDRTSFFGLLDRLSLARAAPKAYFDWSFGAMERRVGDLSIDPRLCDERATETIAFWLGSIQPWGEP